MRIQRTRREKKSSWLSRFWNWLTHNAGETAEASEPSAYRPVQPDAADHLPQGTVYQMLSAQPKPATGQSAAMQVYDYCGVMFYKADIVYHYINPGLELHVGDRVMVPVHIHGGSQTAEAVVVSSGEYLAQCVPYPVGQASRIIAKL